MLAVLWLLIGLALLVLAGDRLVTSASRLAIRLGLSTVVIGATVVAFGTSMPEFTVSLLSALEGKAGVAAGNVIGSNIANILLVLGLAATISPLAVHRRMLRFDIPILLAVTAWALLLFADGEVSRVEGGVSVALLLGFTVVQLRWFKALDVPDVADVTDADLEGVPVALARAQTRMGVELPILAAAIGALAFGSWLFVRGATELAEAVGVSEFAIGATVVAVGTSLPEVVTSAIAALKREDDIAIGNVVGSNLFNVLGVLGGASLAAPFGVSQDLFAFELPVMGVTALVLVPLMWRRSHIGRAPGIALLVGFVAFTVLTLLRGA